MVNLREFQKKIAEQGKKRVGDIYEECEKRGCNRHFLQAFDTRIWLFPIEQAKTFLSFRDDSFTDQARLEEYLRQYSTFLEVLIEKRPDHEKRKEWESALREIQNAH